MTRFKEEFEHLIKSGRLAHAYLFFGPGAQSIFSFAKNLAAFLEVGKWPKEEPVRALTDAMIIEPDASGTIGIDAARAIRGFVAARPFVSKYRTVIVNRAAALTTEAQNALLKVAEEPSSAGLLILIARDPDDLAPTLISRLQKIYFPGVGKVDLAHWEAMVNPPAEKFFRTPSAARKDFVKALVEPEDFSFRAFLDALIWKLTKDAKWDRKMWHSVLELRAISDATGLNPRIQLMSLLSS